MLFLVLCVVAGVRVVASSRVSRERKGKLNLVEELEAAVFRLDDFPDVYVCFCDVCVVCAYFSAWSRST